MQPQNYAIHNMRMKVSQEQMYENLRISNILDLQCVCVCVCVRVCVRVCVCVCTVTSVQQYRVMCCSLSNCVHTYFREEFASC